MWHGLTIVVYVRVTSLVVGSSREAREPWNGGGKKGGGRALPKLERQLLKTRLEQSRVSAGVETRKWEIDSPIDQSSYTKFD